MTKKIYWRLAAGAGVCLLAAVFVSCYSISKHDSPQRLPASYDTTALDNYLAVDPFSKDGYDHNSVRVFQEGKSLSQGQMIQELAGREIWFKSAPNERLHSYVFPQKLNAPIDWYRILRTDRRYKRFASYGMINDPDCCTPGDDCKSKGIAVRTETFGFDYCPGDENLGPFVGARDLNYLDSDPACQHPILRAADALDNNPRENSCELAFGTSTGVVGFRKFPNPRFNSAVWQKIGGWQGYQKRMTDNSIEPPFRIGIACASCHAAFDPLNPPRNLETPQWANIKGETGNQYLKMSEILGSGTDASAIEYQMFTHTRPGVVDTSAIPNDFINNPGTMNAVINFPVRPQFTEEVQRWENVPRCSGNLCQTVAYKDGRVKNWELRTGPKKVMHILKGGEDSVGADLAVQRVYVNIGMCAEQCWMNHLTNNRELDPTLRGFGQTPFDISQCRADCASWRANEDRVGDILSYLLSRRPTDLKDAMKKQGYLQSSNPQMQSRELERALDKRYGGQNLVQRGSEIFAKDCARCHSSQNADKQDMIPTTDDFTGKNFSTSVVLDSGEIIRADWLGNDKSTKATEVGTFICRSLHSNHTEGHVWSQFSSISYKKKPVVYKDIKGKWAGGGRGYYRNISLLNVWAHAPLMHNNAVGPEICGSETDPEWNMHRSTYEGTQTDPKAKLVCDSKYDPTVEGRLAIFDKSIDELLTPEQERRPKISRTDVRIRYPLGAKIGFFGKSSPLYLDFPAGIPTSVLSNLDIKGLMSDLRESLLVYDKPAEFDAFWSRQAGEEGGKQLADATRKLVENTKRLMSLNPSEVKKVASDFKSERQALTKLFVKYYTSCDALVENKGHNFKTSISEDDKKALKAFLATL